MITKEIVIDIDFSEREWHSFDINLVVYYLQVFYFQCLSFPFIIYVVSIVIAIIIAMTIDFLDRLCYS